MQATGEKCLLRRGVAGWEGPAGQWWILKDGLAGLSGSGDGRAPISLSNCQKSNLVSGARAGLRLNGERQARP